MCLYTSVIILKGLCCVIPPLMTANSSSVFEFVVPLCDDCAKSKMFTKGIIVPLLNTRHLDIKITGLPDMTYTEV
jgi:hypothetical protein